MLFERRGGEKQAELGGPLAGGDGFSARVIIQCLSIRFIDNRPKLNK